ncbi:hypothetical protein Tco_1260795 [Tanacetum coccineum]
MRMRDMILQRRVGRLRKEMKAMLTLSFGRVVRHLAKVEVFPNLGVSGDNENPMNNENIENNEVNHSRHGSVCKKELFKSKDIEVLSAEYNESREAERVSDHEY